MIWVIDNGEEYSAHELLFVATSTPDEDLVLETILARPRCWERAVARIEKIEWLVEGMVMPIADYLRGRHLPPGWSRDKGGRPIRAPAADG